jgi:multicomponent Na+:H+ antiporter subunit G
MISVVYAFLVLGLFFGVLGNIGVLLFPDVYTRLQASSKCSVTSLLSILIALMLLKGFTPMTVRILVITVFFLVSTPVASHIIGRRAWEEGIISWRRERPNREERD